MMHVLKRFYIARPRLIIALAIGVVVALLSPAGVDVVGRALIGWNSAVYLYICMLWIMMARADDSDVRRIANLQDESAYVVLALVCAAAVMSLVAIVLELATLKQDLSGHGFRIVLTAATVVGSWVLIPTIFGLHYAHMFYQAPKNAVPLNFPDDKLMPDYWDFLYFSFTIAVASQTSDVTIKTRPMRKAVLAQSVLSFFFNASILALSINISATLVAP